MMISNHLDNLCNKKQLHTGIEHGPNSSSSMPAYIDIEVLSVWKRTLWGNMGYPQTELDMEP